MTIGGGPTAGIVEFGEPGITQGPIGVAAKEPLIGTDSVIDAAVVLVLMVCDWRGQKPVERSRSVWQRVIVHQDMSQRVAAGALEEVGDRPSSCTWVLHDVAVSQRIRDRVGEYAVPHGLVLGALVGELC